VIVAGSGKEEVERELPLFEELVAVAVELEEAEEGGAELEVEELVPVADELEVEELVAVADELDVAEEVGVEEADGTGAVNT